MKGLIIVAVLVACVQGSIISKIAQKLVPSFASDFVIKGYDAEPHSAPFIVSLSRKTVNHSHICGGTIIDKSWVVTAAHCISKAKGMGVLAGLHKLSNVDNKTQSREVDYGKVHPEYTGGVGPYDIALLHLSEPLELTEYVQPAVLPAAGEAHSGKCHLYGWGQSKPYSFIAADTLQTVETEIVPYDECVEKLPKNAPIHKSNVCSDSLQKSISACNGDSGGPLVTRSKGAASQLIGIVSWGYIPCGVLHMPSVYTDVSYYSEWITAVKHAFNVLH